MIDIEDSSLLGRFAGARPPMAPWVADALAQAPERRMIAAADASIELLTWGARGAPGLLFLHGSGAHADWWSFTAPFFADRYRCAALSWSGMGRSSWRDGYSFPLFAAEALAAIDAAGLADAGPPVVIAHSFGGGPLAQLAAMHADRIAGGIMVDSFLRPPGSARAEPPARGPTRRYPSEVAALARFRFAPPQRSDYPEIVDHFARHALREVPADADGPAGWTWCFDPAMWANMDWSGNAGIAERIGVPIGLIDGAKSKLVEADAARTTAAQLPDCAFLTMIPQAEHHIMADQPLALIAALDVGVQALERRSATAAAA